MPESLDIVLIFISLVFNLYLYRRCDALNAQIKAVERKPAEVDESSIEKIETTISAANQARRELGQQVGIAKVATREANQAASNIRSARSQGGKKW